MQAALHGELPLGNPSRFWRETNHVCHRVIIKSSSREFIRFRGHAA